MGGVETGPSLAESRQKSKALLLTQVLALRTSHRSSHLTPRASHLPTLHFRHSSLLEAAPQSL